jgi:stearoyl-CoA desaturase (delta-9 desaturase)
MFDPAKTNQQMFVPDLLKDADLKELSRYFGGFAILSLALPPLVELAVGGPVGLIFQAFLWGSLIRVFMIHHVSWSVNSICHVIGSRPHPTKDRSTNFWPLAILSMGESWHNFHHAMPACARHGILKGQIDISARVIYIFELLGWATCVKWPGEFRERGQATPRA